MSYKERGTLQAETADPKESIYHTVGYKLDALRCTWSVIPCNGLFVCTSRILFKVQNCVIDNGQLVTKWENP